MASEVPVPTPDHLEVLEGMLPRELVHDEPGKLLYHYTNAEGLKGILENRNLRATDFRYLNDTEEMKEAERVVETQGRILLSQYEARLPREVLERFTSSYERLSLSTHFRILVASLSENPDLLSQWRAYGADGAGYAVGFDGLQLPLSPDAQSWVALSLLKCEYDEGAFAREVRRRIEEVLKALEQHDESSPSASHDDLVIAGITLITRRTATFVPRLKSRAFSEEGEWRYVVLVHPTTADKGAIRYKAGPSGLIPYFQIPLLAEGQATLAEIVVGPSMHQADTQSVEAFARQQGFAPAVRRSVVPYRAKRS